MKTSILKGQDILAVHGIREEDESQSLDIAFQIQRILSSSFSTLVVIVHTKAHNSCKTVISKLQQLNSSENRVTFTSLDDDQFKKQIDLANGNGEIFHLKEYDIHKNLTDKQCQDATFFKDLADLPLIQQRLNKTILLLNHAKEFNIAPCILITGETGSGKTHTAELIANELKRTGNRKGKFVPMNCGSLPKDHIDSLLFGIVGKKWTGVETSKGAIEEADNGVLFLDEIGNLPLDAQTHILTFLDKGKYHRYGEDGVERQADCIIIFGTNANLKNEIVAGNFRRDLYARINSFEISIPTLSMRIANNATGAEFLATITSQMCKQHGGMSFTDQADTFFKNFAKAFHWQNNFRDLKHFFENLAIELLWDGCNKVVSAKLMLDTIQSYTQNYPIAIPSTDSSAFHESEDENVELPIDPSGLAEYEILTLKHLVNICAKSPNKAAAGRLFFNGKDISNHSDALAKFLKRYGLKWDSRTLSHVIQFPPNASSFNA